MAKHGITVKDPSVAPRPGQHLVLDFHGRQFAGTVQAFGGDRLQVRPESLSFLRQLRPGTQLTATFVTAHGVAAVTVRTLAPAAGEEGIGLQLLDYPVLIQRRRDPRVTAGLAATLAWLNPADDQLHQTNGTTQNVSVGGALIRFSEAHQPVPGDNAAVLIALRLPSGAISAAARAIQTWDAGARVLFVHLTPEMHERLDAFVLSRLI